MERNFEFTPIYIMEICRTFAAGIMATSVANYLILERGFHASQTSVISGAYFAGFMLFTLFLGHIGDHWGQKRALIVLNLLSVVFGFLFLIPIQSDESLISFSIFRFLDGGLNGIFWPTIQKYSVVSHNESKESHQSFLKFYNLSWNLGFLISMLGGNIIVYFTGSNYSNFFVNLGINIIGLVIAIVWLQEIPQSPEKLDIPTSESIDNIQESDLESIDQYSQSLQPQNQPPLKLHQIFLVLLVHAFIDGGILIALPLKITEINKASYWVFGLSLTKATVQTFATTYFSNLRKRILFRSFLGAILGMILGWVLFIPATDLLFLFILLAISGFFQGLIYAIAMQYTSMIAQRQQSARAFSYYQGTMGSGRMIGQLIIGGFSSIRTYLGIGIIIIYDVFVFFATYIKHKLAEKN